MASRPSYGEALAVLSAALKFGLNPSLDGIIAIADELGRPQDAFRCVQVTGTNGKTSVTWLTAALLHLHGERVGAYTSPHLESYTERIAIDGSPLSQEAFAASLCAADEAAKRAGLTEVTEFELLTAAALHAYREAAVEWAVLEVGMGGRWDATSVVIPAVAVVTGVDLDHAERLGATIEAIAEDKAYVVKAGSTAVLGPGTLAVRGTLHRRADEVHAAVVEVEGLAPEYEGFFRAGGLPPYQAANVATALAAARAALGRPLEPVVVRRVLTGARLAGRFETEREEPRVLLDGAHNPGAAAALSSAVQDAFGASGPLAVLAVLADKDAGGIVRALAPAVSGFIVTANVSPRCLSADALADIVARVTAVRPPVEPDLASALRRALDAASSGTAPGVLVTGSLYTVGEARALLRGM